MLPLVFSSEIIPTHQSHLCLCCGSSCLWRCHWHSCPLMPRGEPTGLVLLPTATGGAASTINTTLLPALSFQKHTLLKQEREGYFLQKTPKRITQRERKPSRFSLWEFWMDVPSQNRSGVSISVSHKANTPLP